jgi:hypothetical protein
MDGKSFSCSLSLRDNVMLHLRPMQSLTDNVYFMRQSFDDYNESCDMIDGSTAIHLHHLSILMLHGISCNRQFGQAKQCRGHVVSNIMFISSPC